MWITLAFVSSLCLGLYEVAKKKALEGGDTLAVLLVNVSLAFLLLSPALISAEAGLGWFDGGVLDCGQGGLREHLLTMLKSVIVLSSWVCGYMALRHLPMTVASPIVATRPVAVIIGALLIFGEMPGAGQWAGILITLVALTHFRRSTSREGIDWHSNRWVWLMIASTLLGAVSGLYDKHLMRGLNPVFVQGWFLFYQAVILAAVIAVRRVFSGRRLQLRWNAHMPLVSVLLVAADFAYFNALSDPESMISIVSMIRGGSVIVSFITGALLFKEHNIRHKAADLTFILIGLALIFISSR